MRKLLVAALLVLLCPSAASSQPAFERLAGIGKDRETITAAQLISRTKAAADTQEFWILRQLCTKDAPKRILGGSYYQKIVSEAAKYGMDPFWPAAVFYIESCGDPLAKSPKGPRGLGQHTLASAHEQGMVVQTTKRKIGTRKEPVYKWRGKGKNRRQVLAHYKTVTDYEITNIDERLNPDRAIEATEARLDQRTRWFGDITWAVVDYHMGTTNLLRALSLYTGVPLVRIVKGKIALDVETARRLIREQGLTWERVFFHNTPYFKPQLYDFLLKLRQKNDFSPTYLFRVLKAKELLQLYRQNPLAYEARWNSYQNRFRPNVVTPNLMWTFFTPEDVEKFKYRTLRAIQEAQGKELVLLPEPWSQYGIRVRLDGSSKIAEKDPKNQAHYIASSPQSIGCLLYFTAELKRLEGKAFGLLETNSLVRTEVTQGALKVTNENARTLLPTHELAWGFDLPKKGMKNDRKKNVLFLLYDMELQGMLTFVNESTKQDTTHVGPHPNFRQFFSLYYRTTVPQDQQIRTLPR